MKSIIKKSIVSPLLWVGIAATLSLTPCLAQTVTSTTQADSNTTTDANLLIFNHLAQMHGVAGPWALLGYRAGEVVLEKLKVKPHSRALQIIHRSPAVPQYSCMVDGVGVATGNSVGQLNLRLQAVQTTTSLGTIAWLKDDNGTSAILVRPSEATVARYAVLPPGKAGMEWANMNIQSKTNDELFDVEWIDRPQADKP